MNAMEKLVQMRASLDWNPQDGYWYCALPYPPSWTAGSLTTQYGENPEKLVAAVHEDRRRAINRRADDLRYV